MKDVFDMVTDIRSLINIPAITGLINGKVWPTERPAGRAETDFVVNGLAITNTPDQIGYGNVNIHVASLTETANGRTYSMPDQAKLSALAKAVTPYLDAQFKYSFRTEIEEGARIVQDTDGSWFVNIKVKYYSYNKNYQNI